MDSEISQNNNVTSPAGSLIDWIKTNKLAALVIAVLFLLLTLSFLPKPVLLTKSFPVDTPTIREGKGGFAEDLKASDQIIAKQSSLSLVVSDVTKRAAEVADYAKKEGGVFISQDLTSPEESPRATVSVRVPATKLVAVSQHYRSLAIKVSSEYIAGTDITREVRDVDAQIKLLEDGLARLGEIRAKASSSTDLLTATREMLSLQQQIDSLKSQKNFLAETANFSRIDVYLATDELALPYQPSTQFRPDVIFKQAIRTLFENAYALGAALIWGVVYGAVLIPVLAFLWLLAKKFKLF